MARASDELHVGVVELALVLPQAPLGRHPFHVSGGLRVGVTLQHYPRAGRLLVDVLR